MNLLIIFCRPGRASRRYYPETRAKRAPIPGTGSNRHDFPTGRAGRSLFAKALLLGGPRVRISFPPAPSQQRTVATGLAAGFDISLPAVRIKSTFRISRSAAAGSHAAGTPGHAPGGCAGRCVPGQSARQYKGQGPMDFAAFTGTPGGMPMAFVRCYTGTDGQSHFEDLDLLPPDMERSIEQAASSITFTRSPNGRFSDWHNAPRRQYAIFLSGGQMEVVIGDGTTRRFGPGDAVLFEDLTGQGHASRSVGGDRLTAIVPLAD